MAKIDYVTFNKVVSEVESETVVPQVLEQATLCVYKMWSRDKKRDKVRSDTFHSYYGLSLLELGIDTLFEAEPYRKALGAYFSQRSRLSAQLRKEERKSIPPVPSNKVDSASASKVVIRVVPEISLHFEAVKSEGRLKLAHVRKIGKSTHANGGTYTKEEIHKARVQALATMNNIRRREKQKVEGGTYL